MPNFRLKLAALVASAVMVVGCSTSGSASPEQFYSTGQVTRGDMAEVIQTYGQITAQEEETLTFGTVSGTISEVLVSVGQTVQAGDPLVRLNTAALEKALVEAKADLVVAEAKLREAEVTASESAVLEAEANLISAENAVSKAYLDWQIAIATGLESLQNAVTKAQADVALAQQQLEMTQLTAQSGQIRELEYDEAFLQRSLRDITPEQDPAPIQEQLEQTQQSLATARASRESSIQSAQDVVDQAEQDLARAQAKLQRATNGTDDPTVSAELAYTQAVSQRDAAQKALDDLNQGGDPASVEAAKTTYDAALAKVEEIESKIEDTTLTAPFAGVIFSLNAQEGQVVTSSDQIIYLANPSELSATANVSEVDVVKLSLGQEVRATFDAFPDELVIGELESIDQQADTQSGIPAFAIKVAFDETPDGVSPGLSANLRIIIGERQDVIMVPAAALQQDWENVYVQVQKASGSWETRTITIGINDGIMVEVLSGLEEGETVMLPLTDTSTDTGTGVVEPLMEDSNQEGVIDETGDGVILDDSGEGVIIEDAGSSEAGIGGADSPEIIETTPLTDTVSVDKESTEAR